MSEYIQDVSVNADGGVDIMYAAGGGGDTYVYQSANASISEPADWNITSDNNLEWVDIGRGIQVTIDESDFRVAPPANGVFTPGDENQAPAQVTIEALPDGNMAADMGRGYLEESRSIRRFSYFWRL